MKVHVNVFTPNIGYSGWDFDLGFTILPKYKIKQMLQNSLNKWFTKGKNVYAYAVHNNSVKNNSYIVHIHFYNL